MLNVIMALVSVLGKLPVIVRDFEAIVAKIEADTNVQMKITDALNGLVTVLEDIVGARSVTTPPENSATLEPGGDTPPPTVSTTPPGKVA